MTQTDKILISRIDCVAAIGVTAEERTVPQRLSIDLEFSMDCRKPAATDSLKDAIDYARVAAAVSETCAHRDFHLIETLAELIASRVLKDFPTPQVRVLVRKISPVAAPRVEYVSIEILRP
jgi:7,8-dihydroneopterin aldolase/epimerase/oxygenase